MRRFAPNDSHADSPADTGVFHPLTGSWYLNITKTGSVNKTFLFGTMGDFPKVGKWS